MQLYGDFLICFAAFFVLIFPCARIGPRRSPSDKKGPSKEKLSRGRSGYSAFFTQRGLFCDQRRQRRRSAVHRAVCVRDLAAVLIEVSAAAGSVSGCASSSAITFTGRSEISIHRHSSKERILFFTRSHPYVHFCSFPSVLIIDLFKYSIVIILQFPVKEEFSLFSPLEMLLRVLSFRRIMRSINDFPRSPWNMSAAIVRANAA